MVMFFFFFWFCFLCLPVQIIVSPKFVVFEVTAKESVAVVIVEAVVCCDDVVFAPRVRQREVIDVGALS